VYTPRLHRHPNSNSIVRKVQLKISALLIFQPVEEKLDARTVLTGLLFLYDLFLLKNLVMSAELLGADISVVMHVRLSVHLSVLLLEKLYTL
jgi:hypothetical protein